MGWFDSDSEQAQAHEEFENSDNQASLTHELIAGAASYEAAKKYEEHYAENGELGSHEEAKEILAGFTGAFIDREAETRGMDMYDQEKAKRSANEQLENAYSQN